MLIINYHITCMDPETFSLGVQKISKFARSSSRHFWGNSTMLIKKFQFSRMGGGGPSRSVHELYVSLTFFRSSSKTSKCNNFEIQTRFQPEPVHDLNHLHGKHVLSQVISNLHKSTRTCVVCECIN